MVDNNASWEYINTIMNVARSRVELYGRLPLGEFAVSQNVFLAVEARLQNSFVRGFRADVACGELEDTLLLSIEQSYPISRRNPKFDIDDWYSYVDETIQQGEAEVYLWWITYSLEKRAIPNHMSARIELFQRVMNSAVDEDLISALISGE